MATSRDLINQTADNLGITYHQPSPMRPVVEYLIGFNVIRVRYTQAGQVYVANHRRKDGTVRMILGGADAVRAQMRQLYAEAWQVPASAPERGTDAFDEIDRSDRAAADFERDPQRTGEVRTTVATARELVDMLEAGPITVADAAQKLGVPPSVVTKMLDRLVAAGRVARLTGGDVILWVLGPQPRPTWDYIPPVESTYSDPAVRDAIADTTGVKAAQERTPAYAAGPMITVTVIGPEHAPEFELGRWDVEEADFVHLATLSRQELAELIYHGAAALSRTTN